MAGIISTLRYLRLKLLITTIRLIVRLLTPAPQPTPDAVLHVPSRDAGRTIRIHAYYPPPSSSSSSEDDDASKNPSRKQPKPVLINLYGSAFALPRLFGTDDAFCRFAATRAGHIVLDIDYRVGPEHPFPAALHDVEDVIQLHVLAPTQPEKKVNSNLMRYEYDPTRVSVSGFSSGGTLALVAPTVLPHNTFRCALAFYPSVSLVGDPAARRAPAPGQGSGGRTPVFWTRLFREGYLADGEVDARDPRVSPIYAVDLEEEYRYLGTVLVITAENDVSATEAEEFVGRVGGRGGNTGKVREEGRGRGVVLRRVLGCGHAFDKSKKFARQRDEAYELAIELLTEGAGDGRE